MSSLTFVGLVDSISDPETITTKSGREIVKRYLVLDISPIDNPNQFSAKINFAKIEFTNDKCSWLQGLRLGEKISVYADLKGFKYTNSKKGTDDIFMSLNGWRVERMQQDAPVQEYDAARPANPQPAPQPAAATKPVEPTPPPSTGDDLPF